MAMTFEITERQGILAVSIRGNPRDKTEAVAWLRA